MGLLSSLFGGGKPNEDQQAKQEKKNFEIKAASLIMKKDVERFIKHDILKNKYLRDIAADEIMF